MTVEVTKISGDRVEFIQDGVPNCWHGLTANGSAADLRVSAASMAERAADLQRRAEVVSAVAEVKERQDAVAALNTSTQRRERSARTRAHNADPWGFEAIAHP